MEIIKNITSTDFLILFVISMIILMGLLRFKRVKKQSNSNQSNTKIECYMNLTSLLKEIERLINKIYSSESKYLTHYIEKLNNYQDELNNKMTKEINLFFDEKIILSYMGLSGIINTIINNSDFTDSLIKEFKINQTELFDLIEAQINMK